MDAHELRERLVASLLSDPATRLTLHDAIVVLSRARSEIAILTVPGDATLDRLRPGIEALLGSNPPGVLHIVIVGGSAGEIVPALRALAPEAKSHRFGLDHVDAHGAYEHVAGQELRGLEPAVGRIPTTEPLTGDKLVALLALNESRRGENTRLAAALKRGVPWVTIGLGAACVVLFALGQYWGDGRFGAALGRMGVNVGEAVWGGDVWRLLASAFLHANTLHLIVNMISLAVLGPTLERLLGRGRYLVLYLVAALGGSLASALLRDSPGGSVGASGAIWGLMCAGIGLALRPRGLLPEEALARARTSMVAPLAINLVISFQPGIDLYAHLGGGVAGFALMVTGAITAGVTPQWTEAPAPPRRSLPVTIAAAVLGAAAVASIAAALVIGEPWRLRGAPELTLVKVGDTELELMVPSDAATPSISERGSQRGFVFGSPSDPIVVEVTLTPLADPVAPEELEVFLEEQRAAEQQTTDPNLTPTSDARITSVGGYPFVTRTHRAGRVKRQGWTTVFGELGVNASVYTTDDPPDRSSGIATKIVESLRHPKKLPIPVPPTLAPMDDAFWTTCKSEQSENIVLLLCDGDQITIEHQLELGGAGTTALRKQALAARLTSDTFMEKHAHALGIPASNAMRFEWRQHDKRGRGVVIYTSRGASEATSDLCYEPDGPTSRCDRIVAHLATKGLPSSLAK